MTETALVVSRFVHELALILLFGVALFACYGPEQPLRRHRSGGVKSLLGLAFLGGLGWFQFSVASMAGDAAAAFDPAMLAGAAVDTPFGRIWLIRACLLVLLFAVASLETQPRAQTTAALSGVLLASLSLVGHTRAQAGMAGFLSVGADALHLLAAGAWIGALPGLLAATRTPASAAVAARRFAGVGYAAVAVLALTGALRAWLMLSGPADLLTTQYGRLLSLKLGLFGLLLALAAHNRLRVAPGLDSGESDEFWSGRLRRNIRFEIVFSLLLLGVVAWLGTLDPSA